MDGKNGDGMQFENVGKTLAQSFQGLSSHVCLGKKKNN